MEQGDEVEDAYLGRCCGKSLWAGEPKFNILKNLFLARQWWHIPLIPALEGCEAGRTLEAPGHKGQPGLTQNKFQASLRETLSQIKIKKKLNI